MSFKFHLVKRTTISAPVQNGGWVLMTWFFLTRLCWENGCGDMLWRGMIFGER